MLPLAVAILVASLLGSFHCAGMCGAFVAIATGGTSAGARRQAALQSAYHLGRLATYATLGAAAGAAGRLIDLTSALAGTRPVAAILAGGVMVAFGVITLLRARGVSLGRLPLPAAWLRIMHAGHRAAMNRPPLARAAMIGLLTTLLPCGWLYAFVLTAAGTGSALKGAAFMAVFWIGTLPTLVALGAGMRAALGPIGARLPTLTASLLVVAGLYTLVGRAVIDPVALAGRAQSMSHAAHGAALSQNVPDPKATSPCCELHDARH